MKETELKSQSDTPREHASRAEIEAAIKGLTPEQLKKLMVWATYLHKRFGLSRASMTPEDLFQEVMYRTLKLEDARRWPKDIPFWLHVKRSLESVAKNSRQRAGNAKKAEDESQVFDTGSTRHDDQESTAIAREELEALRHYFADDDQAYKAVFLRAQGKGESEIQDELGISVKEWETVRKRVRRKLASYLK